MKETTNDSTTQDEDLLLLGSDIAVATPGDTSTETQGYDVEEAIVPTSDCVNSAGNVSAESESALGAACTNPSPKIAKKEEAADADVQNTASINISVDSGDEDDDDKDCTDESSLSVQVQEPTTFAGSLGTTRSESEETADVIVKAKLAAAFPTGNMKVAQDGSVGNQAMDGDTLSRDAITALLGVARDTTTTSVSLDDMASSTASASSNINGGTDRDFHGASDVETLGGHFPMGDPAVCSGEHPQIAIPGATKSANQLPTSGQVLKLHFLHPSSKQKLSKEEEYSENVAAVQSLATATAAPLGEKLKYDSLQKLHFLQPTSKNEEKSLLEHSHIQPHGQNVEENDNRYGTEPQKLHFLNPSGTNRFPTQPPPPPQLLQQQRDQGLEEEKEEIPLPDEQGQPGAYSNVPGEDVQRAEKIRFGLVGVATAQNSSASSHPITPSSVEGSHLAAGGSSDLAVARPLPVEEQEDLPQAEEVDPIVTEQKVRQMWQFKAKVIAVGLLCVVAIVLAVVLTKNGDETTSPMMGLDPVGTEVPTSAPALAPESYVKSLLPYYTVKSIEQDGMSPQCDAFQFILQDLAQRSDYPDWKILQRFALATFCYATGGKNWKHKTNWLTRSVDECDWCSPLPQLQMQMLDGRTGKPIRTLPISETESPCNKDGAHQHLTQCGNEANGTLPPEIFELLPALVSVNLDPQGAEWACSASDIQCGYISKDVITGSIPSQIGLCSQLQHLSLDYQRLTGSLPSNLWELSLLEHLRLADNAATGTIPTEIGRMSSLTCLGLSGAALTGTIPTEIGRMSSLTHLGLSGAALTGTIPTEIGRMSSLTNLGLSGDALTGTIPTEIGRMSSLTDLGLYGDALTGTIPTEIGRMSSLTWLGLCGDALTGTIPTEIGRMSSLTGLGLEGDALTGTIPTEIGWMSSLTGLGLEGGALTGTIPTEIGRMSSLTLLGLDGDALTCTIPTEIGRMSSLTSLGLCGDALTGTIPTEIGRMSSLTSLYLCGAALTGTIPTEIGRMSSLTDLGLYSDALTGTCCS